MIEETTDTKSEFRARLLSLMDGLDISMAAFCRRHDIDRSALSQFLNNHDVPIPRVDVLVKISQAFGVSTDWLTGVSSVKGAIAEVIEQKFRVADQKEEKEVSFDPLVQWIKGGNLDAVIKHHTITLPDYLFLPDIHQKYYTRPVVKNRQDYLEKMSKYHDGLIKSVPRMNFETCFSLQVLNKISERKDRWSHFEKQEVKAQLLHMADYYEKNYPTQKLYLYDEIDRMSTPILIYGAQKVSFWMGSFYLVFHSRDIISAAQKNFDNMIKIARYFPHEVPDYIRSLV